MKDIEVSLFILVLSIAFVVAIVSFSFFLGYIVGQNHCTLPTAPVGTLSWATSTNTH